MYRGSRLAASFLLFLTGAAATAVAIGVLPGTIGPGGPWAIVVVAVAFGIAHFFALVGVARARAWGRDLAVSLAEAGGGIAIAAIVVGMIGRVPAGSADGRGLAVWMLTMYALLGMSAGRVRLAGSSRRTQWPSPLLRVAA